MVKLYREEVSAQADAIEAEFKEMVLGYDRVVISTVEAHRLFGAGHSLPVIADHERTVSGEAVAGYLKELQNLMHDWQRFQGDYCYEDEDGETC
jgi:hypothetical protein